MPHFQAHAAPTHARGGCAKMALYSREASNINAIRTVNSKHKHMEMLFLDRLKVRGYTCALSFWQTKRALMHSTCTRWTREKNCRRATLLTCCPLPIPSRACVHLSPVYLRVHVYDLCATPRRIPRHPQHTHTHHHRNAPPCHRILFIYFSLPPPSTQPPHHYDDPFLGERGDVSPPGEEKS